MEGPGSKKSSQFSMEAIQEHSVH